MSNGMNAYTAYSGNQFWRLTRTSYSAEQSVPFGPNLADAAGDPGRGANFTTFKATIHISMI
ncbi:MAG: hypothetical protein P4L63_00885 [Candidatus Pacebacteria bacterium]|nr:hypothetical protein [Candidatus Paceibacterota bacterium]